ncbi:hypothetical protein M569_13348 [Genlisea aurea]|uniref:UTP-monosaccharide-1-phosphate uridylyltransferase n=1 Tax=Genlisea aurea TaxID=192259 RepID=S8DP24_9LAMI|nr:hypothetical protein M569_13348 [Genlisea aurea]
MASSAVASSAGDFSKLRIEDYASSAPNLYKNLSLLSPDQVELAKGLLDLNQAHLFQHWDEPGVEDDEKRALLEQITLLNGSYPGGLASYIKTARQLLADSKAGKNPYDGFTPSVPSGEVLKFADDNFIRYEEIGVREARRAAFVLVAGGLGERLGYNGIKVALPLESTTGTSFLQHYVESILALQDASLELGQGEGPTEIPLAIMTSDDTHSRTQELLQKNSYFGMKPTQIKFIKQEKVACLDDNDARLALDPKNKYRIQTKPHGHGDVHSLLYSSGLLKQWLDAGRKWVLFFQDTNGLLFKAIPASLGVSAAKEYHVNSLAVPRKAKEAIGGITRLTHQDGRTMVINVEYNQLDPLLRASGYPNGDVNDETGYSPFPGNINQLIFEIGPYLEELSKTGGAIKEFVNPKYKDSTKTDFKSSTRLECMMQDYPKTLPPSARVGFTVADAWLAYAPVKNNPEDAAKVIDCVEKPFRLFRLIDFSPSCYMQVPKGNPYHSATSGEMAIYRANSLILREAGVEVSDPIRSTFNGQEVEVWPRVTWKPKWGVAFSEIKSKVSGDGNSITGRSTLAIGGRSVYLENLALDGALIIDAVDGAKVKATGSVQNAGWKIENVDFRDTALPEEVRIRGFKIGREEQLEGTYEVPGEYSIPPPPVSK